MSIKKMMFDEKRGQKFILPSRRNSGAIHSKRISDYLAHNIRILRANHSVPMAAVEVFTNN
jgi:hypothetical protein